MMNENNNDNDNKILLQQYAYRRYISIRRNYTRIFRNSNVQLSLQLVLKISYRIVITLVKLY